MLFRSKPITQNPQILLTLSLPQARIEKSSNLSYVNHSMTICKVFIFFYFYFLFFYIYYFFLSNPILAKYSLLTLCMPNIKLIHQKLIKKLFIYQSPIRIIYGEHVGQEKNKNPKSKRGFVKI